jgi:hypothetical protein
MTFHKIGDAVPIGKPLDVEEMKKKVNEEIQKPTPIKIPDKKDESK